VALLVWLAAFVLCGGALVAATDRVAVERRSHFRLRLTVLALAPLTVTLALMAAVTQGLLSSEVARMLEAFLPLIGGPALMLVPAFLFRGLGPSSGPSDGDGGGGGGGPDRPPEPPATPRGGLPLPDAEQSRVRLRDHDRPAFRRPARRRPAREPVRVPAHHR
jgi:hypothetical protein